MKPTGTEAEVCAERRYEQQCSAREEAFLNLKYAVEMERAAREKRNAFIQESVKGLWANMDEKITERGVLDAEWYGARTELIGAAQDYIRAMEN